MLPNWDIKVHFPGSYMLLQEHPPGCFFHMNVSSSLSYHCSFCQQSRSQWVHEGSCCATVFLVNFCLYKLESPCLCVQDLFAYCFHEGFHSYFMFTPWNFISSRFQSNQICNRGVDRHDWHGNPAANQGRLPLSAYLAAIQPQTRLFTLSSHVSHK